MTDLKSDDGRWGAMSGDAASAVARSQGNGLTTSNPPTRHGRGRAVENVEASPQAVSGPFSVSEADIEDVRRLTATHQRGLSHHGRVRSVALKLYRGGLSADEVGRRIGIHGNVVLAWLRPIGIKPERNRRERKQAPPSPPVQAAPPPAPVLSVEELMLQRWQQLNTALPPHRINGRQARSFSIRGSGQHLGAPRKLTDDDLRKVAEYAFAHGYQAAAIRFSLTVKAVGWRTRKARELGLVVAGAGAKPGPRKNPNSWWRAHGLEAIHQKACEVGFTEAGEFFGVTRNTVSGLLHRNGLSLKKQNSAAPGKRVSRGADRRAKPLSGQTPRNPEGMECP